MRHFNVIYTIICVLFMCKEHGCSQDSIMELQHVEKSTSSGSQLIIDTKDDESFSNETFNISSFPIDLPVETKMKYVEPIFIVDTHYSVDSNESSIPSVFDILSYNNTCSEEIVRFHKTCIIRKYETAEFETELCKGFVNIIRLAYDYSCFENLPSDEIVNASQEYIEKLSAFIKNPYISQDLHREYFQSIANVEKIVEFARATDNQGALQRKLYSLTHIGHDGIQIPPILVPKAYEVQKTYIDVEISYLQLLANLTNHLEENNLTGIFPLLYSLFLEMADAVERDFVEDLHIFAQLQIFYDKLNESNESFERLDTIKLSIAGFIFFLGIILNAILLSVFICFKETRTYANALLINLTIVDTVSLIFNLLVYYIIDKFFYISTNCLVIAALVVIRDVSFIVSIFTVVALSVQRYLAISNSSMNNKAWVSQKTKTIFSISLIWSLGLIYSLSNFAFFKYIDGYCSYDPASLSFVLLNIQFCVLCLIPVFMFAIFSTITFYRLRKSVKNLPGEIVGQNQTIRSRTVSSNVILALMVLAVVSYVAHNAFLYALYFDDTSDVIPIFRKPNALEYARPLTYNLAFLNSCLNPLALYLMSRTFRKYFHAIMSSCKGTNKKAVGNSLSGRTQGPSTSTWIS